jgi:cysteine sulfinate desulfinase/cysteine desulfurase-like protein
MHVGEAVRFSLGRATTWEDLEEVLATLKASVETPEVDHGDRR